MNTKSKGIISRMDNLGRVVIPKELRRELGMTIDEVNSSPVFEVFLVNDGFYVKRRKDLDEKI